MKSQYFRSFCLASAVALSLPCIALGAPNGNDIIVSDPKYAGLLLDWHDWVANIWRDGQIESDSPKTGEGILARTFIDAIRSLDAQRATIEILARGGAVPSVSALGDYEALLFNSVATAMMLKPGRAQRVGFEPPSLFSDHQLLRAEDGYFALWSPRKQTVALVALLHRRGETSADGTATIRRNGAQDLVKKWGRRAEALHREFTNFRLSPKELAALREVLGASNKPVKLRYSVWVLGSVSAELHLDPESNHEAYGFQESVKTWNQLAAPREVTPVHRSQGVIIPPVYKRFEPPWERKVAPPLRSVYRHVPL